MRPSIIRHSFGLPKGIVAAMLGVALLSTVAVDLTSSRPPSALPAPFTWPPGAGPTGRSRLHVTQQTTPSTTTTVGAPTTTAAPAGGAALLSAVRPATTRVPARSSRPASPARSSPSAPAAGPRSARTIPLGVFVGSSDPSAVAAFAAGTGTHPTYVSEYLPGDSGWAGMTGAGDLSWLLSPWRGSGTTLILGVPMFPTGSGGTLAAGAAGQYDSYFVTLADSLVSGGQADAILRLGWEFNGNWYVWSVTDATDAANFAGYFQHIVDAMRSVPGQAFRFVWNPNGGGSYGNAYTPDQTYPGDAYVDYIGTDVYDGCWCTPQTPQNAWSQQLSQPWGLNWLAGFAAAHGKPVVFPEWGIEIRSDGHGMGDDPYFITQFAAWITANNVAWTSYFNYDVPDGTHDLFDATFPNSLAAFRAAFG